MATSSDYTVVIAFCLGILALASAFFLPSIIDATQQDAKTTLELDEYENQNITQRLHINASSVNSTTKTATITYQKRTTLEDQNISLTEGANGTVQLANEDILVTLNEVSDNGKIIVTTQYPPTFGWNRGSREFIKHFDIILALLALTLGMGALKKVIP